MTNCRYITKNGRCGLKGSYAYRHGCFGEDMCRCREPMTNADRIRAMSDEELAELIDRETDSCAPTGDCEKMSRDCKDCWLEWLQQPAEEDDHDA